ncbi:MAG: hypothetical protein ABUT20_57415 [Bacteroidota bacterium]
MKQSFLIFFVFLFAISSFAQNKNSQIEIEPYFRWDKYPAFTNAINDLATYKLDINGNSWGLNFSYKKSIRNNFSLKAGVGYFKYSFNKIVSTHRSFGIGHNRVIDYPTQLDLVLGTDKYWYNTVSLNIGIDKVINFKKNLQINSGITVKNHFTFSQHYHMPYDNSFIPEPELQIQNNYKTKDSRYFGFGADIHIGILNKIGKLYIGPNLIIPIYDNWRQDKIFPTETNSKSRSKWLSGIGVGIICNYSLPKIKHNAK